jgi:hypothetical protein
LSSDIDKFFSADHWIDTGNVARSNPPITVAPVKVAIRIMFLPPEIDLPNPIPALQRRAGLDLRGAAAPKTSIY